jgi:hypothetical protein
MTTSTTDENTFKELIANAIFSASAKAPPPPKEYRFYHCHLDYDGLRCKKVNDSSVFPERNNTKLLFVKSYIPERLDRHILKYKWIPDKVHIEDNST